MAEPAVQRRHRKPIGWRKVTQAVGLILLAIVCPFAALFMTPARRRDEEDPPEVSKE
jgi:hypothetical protein